MGFEQRLPDLLFDIYSATQQPELWAGVLGRIAGEMEASKASLHEHAFDDDSGGRHIAGSRLYSYGYDDEAARDYRERFAPYDTYVNELNKRGPIPSVGTSAELFPDISKLTNTTFYQKYAKRNEIHHVLFGRFSRTARFAAGFAAIRPVGARPFVQKQVEILERLRPHLELAFVVQRGFEARAESELVLQTSIEKAHVASVRLNGSGRVIAMTSSAQALLEPGDPLRFRNRRIEATDPAQDQYFQQMFASALRLWAHPSDSVQNTLRLKRRGGKTWLVVQMYPAKPVNRMPSIGTEAETRVLIHLSDPLSVPASLNGALRTRYRFTEKQALIVCLLRQDLTQKEIAEKLQMKASTVRQHLHNAYDRTGCQGQIKLLRKLRSLEDELA